MLSAFTSPDVLEERTDLKGDVASLSDDANVIGESHRALRVNHILKIVFPIRFFFSISDICRNPMSGHQSLFFPQTKSFLSVELQPDASRIPATLCEFLNWCTSSDFNYQLISRF